jgi:hypothetical protein
MLGDEFYSFCWRLCVDCHIDGLGNAAWCSVQAVIKIAVEIMEGHIASGLVVNKAAPL